MKNTIAFLTSQQAGILYRHSVEIWGFRSNHSVEVTAMVMDMVTAIKEALEEYSKETLRLWAIMIASLIAGILVYPKILLIASAWAWFRAVMQCGSFIVAIGFGLNGSIPLLFKWCNAAADTTIQLWSRRLGALLLILVSIVGCMCTFYIGMLTRCIWAAQYVPFGEGDTVQPSELTDQIWITFVFEEGSMQEDGDKPCEILEVTREPFSAAEKWGGILTWLRYQQKGITPTTVRVKPAADERAPVIRFADPLISMGREALYWHFDKNSRLLGDRPQDSGGKDFAASFSWSVEGRSGGEYVIDSVEIPLEPELTNGQSVIIRWKNSWSSSFRHVLNDQEYLIEADGVGYFYYPGERYLLSGAVLQASNGGRDIFGETLLREGRAALTVECIPSAQVVSDSRPELPDVLPDGADGFPTYLIKTGKQIVYHCFADEEDKGYFYVTLSRDDTMVWNKYDEKQKENALIVLNLTMTRA